MTIPDNIPQVRVGVMSEPSLRFTLNGVFSTSACACRGRSVNGTHLATIVDGRIAIDGELFDDVLYTPVDARSASFTLHDVTIGVSFHWRRREDQRFRGALRIIIEGDKLTAINVLSVEEYLRSVISSEMSATASLQLLKAHAVISRSWLLAQIRKDERLAACQPPAVDTSAEEQIRWWDRDDHARFDVCADDHCQRYQGITRATTPTVAEAVDATAGEVLMHNGRLCDARFSKSCGGVMERFENCWQPVHHHYLDARRDAPDENAFPDLTREDEARRWILSAPEAFCNTADARILSQVLNDYDRETTDFYRWHVEYSQAELAELIARRTGIDFGSIIDLVPVERGTSGRIVKLRVVGSKRTVTIGKELAIRYALSESALYSSAFVVERLDIDDADGCPARFRLHGAGWGHGVGLCQIGAAVMGEKGYDYRAILAHYFIDAEIKKIY